MRIPAFILLFTMMLAGNARAAPADIYQAGPVRPASGTSASDRIDQLVFAQHQAAGIQTADLCSDVVFLRRAYLDLIGTLPTGFEAQEFLQNTDPDKRRKLIDQLFERGEFVDYWTMKWCDLLRVKAEFPINLWPNAAQAYLTASGSNFRVGQVNFYRAMQSRQPEGIAQTVALTFLGERADKWPAEKLNGLAGFFAQVGYKSTQEWKEEIIFHDPSRDTNHLAAGAVFPDGGKARLTDAQDPREVFADWLLDSQNPAFARNLANRAWAWLLGRGIIHEPDDIRPDNLPSNPALLAHLESELVGSGYDLRHLFRVILNSQTYQLSCIPKTDTPEAAAQFAYYPMRRLEAEVLIDALNQLTGSTESYSSPIPEPFTFIPEDQRAIALPDGSITSSFLELFGRPPRDTGVEAERNNQMTAGQRLHLLNSSHVQRKIEQSQMIQFQTSGNKAPRDLVRGLYLGILSRYPSGDELAVLERQFTAGKGRTREAAVDLAWALINNPEFLYRH